MRKALYSLIRDDDENGLAASIYDGIVILAVIASVIPLMVKSTTPLFDMIDKIAVIVFIADYIFRLLTADYKLKRGPASFILYPFTPMAIIDLLAILPSFSAMWRGLKILRTLRFLKMARYSKSLRIILAVVKSQKRPLIAVCILASAYIFVSALVMFNVEPDTFGTFFDALYWSTVSLTTVGYGDLYPMSAIGRLVAMVSSLIGIAVIALPAGIITAGYMAELRKDDEDLLLPTESEKDVG